MHFFLEKESVFGSKAKYDSRENFGNFVNLQINFAPPLAWEPGTSSCRQLPTACAHTMRNLPGSWLADPGRKPICQQHVCTARAI